MAPNERQRARDELSAARDRHQPYRLGQAEEAARLRQKQLDDAPLHQVWYLRAIFWLLMIAMVIVPFVLGPDAVLDRDGLHGGWATTAPTPARRPRQYSAPPGAPKIIATLTFGL